MVSKKQYVASHHSHTIFQIKEGAHKGAYKTYVIAEQGKRKPIERCTYEAMVEALYQFYSGKSKRNSTLQQGFEALAQRKLDKGRAQSTIENNRHTFKRFTINKLQKKPMILVTEDDIYASIRTVLKTVRPSMADVRAYLQILNGIYNLAASHGITQKNPAEYIKPDDFKDAVARPTAAEKRIFSPDEVGKIMDALQSKEPNPRAFAVEIAAWTGMRSGELPSLRWSDIENGYIHVHNSMQLELDRDGKRIGFRELDCTKDEKGVSRGGRYVPIMPQLQEVLERIRKDQRDHGIITDRIIYSSGEVTNKSIEKFFGRLCRSLNLSATGIHSLRRSFNTNVLLPAGLTVTERAAILGHSPEVDERYYLIATKGMNDISRNKLHTFLSA